MSTNSDLKDALKALVLPEIPGPLQEVGRIVDISIQDTSVAVSIQLGFPAATVEDEYCAAIRNAVNTMHPGANVTVSISYKLTAHGVQRTLKPLDNVSNIIAVASGKGGVGKSTTATNLALALARDGARVGVLDADIYGPSQPLMLGLSGKRPTSDDGQSMNPLEAHGIQVMSIGFLIDADQPMVWRGPMVTQALNQLLQQTRWDKLDYLIVDMPPGTGDIQLTLSQQVPVSGAVIVTTPQDLALLDARKGLQMFRKVSVPVLGIVENMSTHICSKCGHEEAIFGSGGGDRMAADFDVQLLGRLPLDANIRQQTDSGTPTVVADPDSAAARAYASAARRMAAQLAMQGKDYSRRFPNIVVEET
ncbi:MAG: iron-sulfur cluster carrier protein ApbC [Gammaproteobacteria bacterium]|nr:iron-sulfur cluster carrier protein ApbC [Gammaproteobacteria bacterium]